MNNTITSVKGISCWGLAAGLKPSGKLDLAVIKSEQQAVCSAVFTKNIVISEHIRLDRLQVADGLAQAVVINSGNANACTGKQGYEGALEMARTAARELNVREQDVIVMSTGIIGREFPTQKVVQGITQCTPQLSTTAEAGELAAEAILTTDTVKKQYQTSVVIDGTVVTIAAIAKGSGMIHPDMGTLLVTILCDIKIEKKILDTIFLKAIDLSFNMISVDGDTSTNDTAVILCNGMAGNKIITTEKAAAAFATKLNEVCIALAKMVVNDGEGITRSIEYKVINASTEQAARQIIRTVSTSSLVKCAFYGKDPNWGRILAAAGRAGVPFDVNKTDLQIGSYLLFKKGQPLKENTEKVRALLEQKEIEVLINLNAGNATATGWGTDLTTDYVVFNSAYTT